jgi:hypothetical protein
MYSEEDYSSGGNGKALLFGVRYYSQCIGQLISLRQRIPE